MIWFIAVIIFLCLLSDSSGGKQKHYRAPGRLSRAEKKRAKRMKKDIVKAREKAKMDAWEDMMSIAVAFMDD